MYLFAVQGTLKSLLQHHGMSSWNESSLINVLGLWTQDYLNSKSAFKTLPTLSHVPWVS